MIESKVWGAGEQKEAVIGKQDARRESGLNPHYSKCGPWTTSSINTWGPV